MIPLRDHLPRRVVPFVNDALIAVNLVVFGLEASLVGTGGDLEQWLTHWALVPARLVAHPWASAPTLLTHMFLHGSLAHLAGNMLYLWIFGDNVEDVLGHVRYAIFYVACGLAAAFAQITVGHASALPMVGASGAIAGVLAAYVLVYPTSRITVVNPVPILWFFWGFFLYFPAWLVILEFFVANLLGAFQEHGGANGGVAFVAHIGGFVAGLVLTPVLRRRATLEYEHWQGWRDAKYARV